MDIAMIGMGYVGLVAGVCLANAGHHIIGTDSNNEKIDLLKKGQLPFFEPGLLDLYQSVFKQVEFSSSITEVTQAANVIFIAVGTPEKVDGGADTSNTFQALKEICQASDRPKTVILKSTLPVGTGEKAQAFCEQNCDYPIEIISNPEFLRQGMAIKDFLHPDRVVVGCGSVRGKELMSQIYKPFLMSQDQLIFMDLASAEMTKYAANSFLALKISFINELASLSESVGADIDQVRRGITSDHRIHPSFFGPGIGYGGSCFPKDVRALIRTASEYRLEMKLLKAADEVNERQPSIIVQKLKKRLGDLQDQRIALWGLSFKANTDDVRQSPALTITRQLSELGAEIIAYDPVAMSNAQKNFPMTFIPAKSALLAAQDAEALLVLTDWDEFKLADLVQLKSRLKTPLIFDGRNIFDADKMKALGFEYYGFGR